MNVAVADAVLLLASHPSVSQVRCLLPRQPDGFIVAADFDTNLPSTWKARGYSPNGIKTIEEVQIFFPRNFPNSAPIPSLRPDFNATLPHINPHNRGDRVPPCIVAGDVLELLHDGGFESIVLQLVDWLEKASEGDLINPSQGWEPIRRDIRQGTLEIDTDILPNARPKCGGLQLYETHSIWHQTGEWSYAFGAKPYAATIFRGMQIRQMSEKVITRESSYAGKTFLAVCWPVTGYMEKSAVQNEYKPDTVRTYRDLTIRAKEYGCEEALSRFSKLFDDAANDMRFRCELPVYVCIPVRRPFPLIGLTTEYEFLVYRLTASIPDGITGQLERPVQPICIIGPITKKLLRRTSGINTKGDDLHSIFVGCGSLGSKVLMHTVRAGYMPDMLVDNRHFVAHNAARHVLDPASAYGVGTKATQMAALIEQFQRGRMPEAVESRVQDLSANFSNSRALLQKQNCVIVNTTGSSAVRRFLTTEPYAARVIEACVTDQGLVGVLTLEGVNKNPTTSDLMIFAYEILRAEGKLNVPDRSREAQLQIGVGCNSVTLPMSDARISLVAAGVGQAMLDFHETGLPNAGSVSLGYVQPDGISVVWKKYDLGETLLADTSDNYGWSVRVLQSAHTKILADVQRHSRVETGGLIVGRIAPLSREVTITDILDAPADSQRQKDRFLLGTEGRVETIREYESSAKGVLRCLGTWHSHLECIGPSSTDIATATQLRAAACSMTILLIRRPDGYSAVLRP